MTGGSGPHGGGADPYPAGAGSPRRLVEAARALTAIAWRSARWHLAAYVLMMVAAAMVPVAAAWLTKLIIDGLTGAPDGTATTTRLVGLAVALAGAGVATAVLPAGSSYLGGEIGRRLVVLTTERLFASVARLPGLRPFEDPRFLDRLRLAQQGSTAAGSTVTDMFSAARASLTLVGFVGALLVISPALTAIVVLTAVPALVIHLRESRWRAGMLWRLSPLERWQFMYSDLLANVNAAKEIRLFGSGGFLRDRMMGQLRGATALRRRMDRRALVIEGLLATIGAAVAGGGLIWAISAAVSGRLTAGDVTLLVSAVAATQGALGSLVIAVAAAHHGALQFGHYLSVVRAGPDLPLAATPASLPPLRHGIEFRDVWFRYSAEHPWVLKGVDLVIPAGRAVGLVGLNGAGKSTLVKLLCRFYDPDRGAILWDGVDLRDVRPEELRSRVSGVFQDYMAYDLSARDNIGIGDAGSGGAGHDDLDRLRAAAALARMDDTLSALPRGYDTLLTRMFLGEQGGEDEAGSTTGVVLSGGQWQRIALARAFFRAGRDLMILDEPSAGLDPDAEADLHRQTRRYRSGRTSLLISHRLNTVRDADLLVVLRDGAVVERGSHDDLIATGGDYARLFHRQADGYRDRTEREASHDDTSAQR
ncbi:ABC transporter ATP-binding protein [Rhizomonospora bruguierae]|uniref:ABC transporter ATP-binding protein n=1 Tax=Rhizomonospora bruguierae TaxID=1581705 RepID=UPI001BCBDFDF|nr:ABC transporter ATP-binding protein [Micromonospora sp. NBRC 107566]